MVAGAEREVAGRHAEDGGHEDELPAELRHHGQRHEAADQQRAAHQDARQVRVQARAAPRAYLHQSEVSTGVT